MRRFLPLAALALLAIFVLPQLLGGKGKSKTLSGKNRGVLTIDAVERIDAAQVRYRKAHGSFTEHVADLVALDGRLAEDLTIGLVVDLDVGAEGKSYFVTATSDALSYARSRFGDATTDTCRVLSSRSKAKCPLGTTPTTSIPTTTASTATTTTASTTTTP